MKRGNLSKDRSTFTWKAEGGVRKTHKLGKHDIFVQISISGDEFVVQQQGRPEQFLVVNSSSLDTYLKKYKSRGASIYLSVEALRSLPHSLGELEDDLHIVYPAYTRFKANKRRGDPAHASHGSSATQANQASSSSSPPPPPAANPGFSATPRENAAPPKGLYVWMRENDVLLFNLLCNSEKLNQYLRQSSSAVCTPEQYDALLTANHCPQGQKLSKCVRRLLSHLHPDKLDANKRTCGEDLYKKLSEAYSELKARPNFDVDQPCS